MTARARHPLKVGLWALVAVMMVVLMYESVKTADAASLAAKSDKMAHALAYGAFACVLVLALRRGSAWTAGKAALVAFAWATAYGAVAEVVQLFVGRTADVLDAAANGVGAGLVALGWWAVARRRAARRHASARTE